jgi:hypothetical protein
MTESAQLEAASPTTAPTAGPSGTIVSLPLVGATTVEDAAFYAVLGIVTAVELVSWPTAALIGSAHALHQRARNHLGIRRGELLEGALEASEDVELL